MSCQRFFLMGMCFELGLGGAAYVLGAFSGSPPLATLTRDTAEPGAFWAAAGTGLLGTLPMLVGLWVLDQFACGPLLRLKELVRTQLVPLFRPMSTLQLGLLALSAGWGEEMLFRGWLQAGVAAWLPGPLGTILGVTLASMLFAACHWLTPSYGVLAMLVSIYLGLLFIAANSLLAPVVAHAAYDFVALLYLTKRPGALLGAPRGNTSVPTERN